MRGFAFSLAACMIVLAASRGALAQHNGGPTNENLRRRVVHLENQVADLDERLRNVERFLEEAPDPEPKRSKSVCLIVDSGYAKSFLGTGRTQIDAEFAARESCQKSVHPTYCSGGGAKLRCDSTKDNRSAKGFVCMVVDTGYGKTFRGEGETAVEAEAKAKQTCQASVHPTYCGNASARCDSY